MKKVEIVSAAKARMLIGDGGEKDKTNKKT